MTLAIRATMDQLQDFIQRAQNAVRALQDVEEIGIIPKETVVLPPMATQAPSRPARKRTASPKPAQKVSAGEGTRICKKCGVTKPLSEFHRHPGFTSGRDSSCRVCRRTQKIKAAAARKSDGTAQGKSTANTAGKLNGKFDCKTCHCSFLSKSALDGHNCLK